MKMNKFLLAFAVAALTCSSCGDEVDEVLDVKDGTVETQNSVFTYDLVFDCDITSYDGTTRATTANDWENGDVVYLSFDNGGTDAHAKAEYISSSKKWRVTCEKALIEASNAPCAAWYGEGVNPSTRDNHIYYDYMTEVYYTIGNYTYSSNSIYVSANMQPQGGRLRFKGIAGTKIRIYCDAGYYYSSHFFGYTYSSGSISLTVGSNGYTDYFVVYRNGNLNNIYLQNQTTGDGFTRYFDSNTLRAGESGYFTIPTTTDLHGWTLLNAINGHTYVDLGLPSGTKWASCNIGAASIYESGGYYAWGETKEKNNYDWSNYTHCNGSYGSCYNIGEDIAGTEYDVAYNLWGGTWRMPSIDQFKELEQSCTKEWTKINGMNGCLITGPNGASIFLPAAGVKSYDQLVSFDQSCDYWSSSQSPDIKEYSKLLHISNTNSWTYETYSRFTGIPVRPICQ